MLLIPLVIAGVLAGLAGMTLSFNQHVGTLHEDRGLAEQVLGALAGNSARVISGWVIPETTSRTGCGLSRAESGIPLPPLSLHPIVRRLCPFGKT